MADLSASFSPTTLSGSGDSPLAHRLAALSYGVLAFIIFAGTRPFQSHLVAEMGRAGRGSSIEALLYLGTTCVCLAVCFHLAGLRLINRWVIGLLLLFGYCGVTLTWSETAFTGTVRLGQLGLVSVAVAAILLTLGAPRVLRVTYGVLVAILALNFISVAIVPGAIHQAGELGTYPIKITSWKGIHLHKNYAGPVAALTVLMASAWVMSGRWWHAAVALAACVFLWKTNSTASLLVLGLSLGLMVFSKLVCLAMGRGAARFALLSLFAGVLVSLPFLSHHFAALLNNPYGLTGRVELWHALSRYIEAYPLTGSGFGSFWRVGELSPILRLTDGWAVRTGQGHNGYLDVAVMIGLPGLVLTALILCLLPGITLLRKLRGGSAYFDILFCFLVFACVHNSVETSLLSANHPVFLALLLAVFGLISLPADPMRCEGEDD